MTNAKTSSIFQNCPVFCYRSNNLTIVCQMTLSDDAMNLELESHLSLPANTHADVGHEEDFTGARKCGKFADIS